MIRMMSEEVYDGHTQRGHFQAYHHFYGIQTA